MHRRPFVSKMARPERFELPTPKFVAWCSIQLSYGRLIAWTWNRSGIVPSRPVTGQSTANPEVAESEGFEPSIEL